MNKKSNETKIIVLGGLGEVGKNMYCVMHDDEIIVIDAGVSFAEGELLGIDYVLPDYTFFSPFGDIAKICEEINKCLSISWDRNKICKDSSLEYANEIMSSTYLDAYYKLLK